MVGLFKRSLLVICTVLIIMPLLMSPVGADWAMFRSDLNRTGVVAGDWSPGEVTWNFSTGDKVRSSPAISDGVVYITSYDGYVYALDGITGTKLWSFKTGGSIETSAVISNGTVFIAAQDEKIYALNSTTGTEIWSKRIINGYHTSTPAVADGVVYFGSGNGTICALNASDGSAFWGFRVNCNPFSSPAVVGGVVYIGAIDSSSGQMYALDAATGAKIWNFSTSTPNNMVYSSPAVVNDVIYFGADDRNVYALNAATGTKIWNYYTGALTESSPAVVNGVVYIGANNGNLYALDASSGAKLWSFSAYNCITSSPAVLDGVVYVGSFDNNLYAVNASNGIELWRYTTGNSIFSSPTVAKGGEVYIGSDDSHLYCLNSKSISPYYQINGASGTNNSGGIKQYITINTDGTITPSTAPIARDENRYTLTSDIGGSIKILKDNIVFDGQGHTVYGNGSAKTGGDITLNRRDHVTIMNTVFTGWFGTAISLGSMDTVDPNNQTGSSNCIITNNTITGGTPDYCFCIWVEGTNNSIINNHIYNNKGMGIALERGTNHLIANNLIENNGMFGISFEYGQGTVQGNRFNNNTCGPYEFTDNLMGMSPAQNIDSSNLVDGKPTYYWINQHNKAVPTDAGVVILINCSYITVSGLHIDKGGKYNSYSIYLADTTNSIISDNTITEGNGIRIQENKIKGSNVSVLRNNLTTGMYTGCNTTIASNTFIGKGIRVGLDVVVAYNNFTNCDVAVYLSSYNSTIRNNNFQNNQVAFHMFGGGNNKIYQNNFIGNSKQAEEQHSDVTQWPIDAYYSSVNNTWNQPLPVGGNYWSDYTGHDTNNDGFGDTAYHVIENYYDQYPIIKKTNTVQPSSENLNPTEKTNSPTPTNSVNPTDNPMPASTQNPLSNQEPNQTNPDTLNQQLPWVLAITGIGIISVILVTLRLHRKPQATDRQTIKQT
jgi:parallel beta-helix repeat protein